MKRTEWFKRSDYVPYQEGTMKKWGKVLYPVLIAVAVICFIYLYASSTTRDAEAYPEQTASTTENIEVPEAPQPNPVIVPEEHDNGFAVAHAQPELAICKEAEPEPTADFDDEYGSLQLSFYVVYPYTLTAHPEARAQFVSLLLEVEPSALDIYPWLATTVSEADQKAEYNEEDEFNVIMWNFVHLLEDKFIINRNSVIFYKSENNIVPFAMF